MASSDLREDHSRYQSPPEFPSTQESVTPSNREQSLETAQHHNRTERLRRFILFRLAVDYDIPPCDREQTSFTREDLRHFLSLAIYCFRRTLRRNALIGPDCLDYLQPTDRITRQPERASSRVVVRRPKG